MDRLFHCGAAFAVHLFLFACSDGSSGPVPGVSVQMEQQEQQKQIQHPEYLKTSLAKAEQVSGDPQALIDSCLSKAKELKHDKQTALIKYLDQCIEDAGMN